MNKSMSRLKRLWFAVLFAGWVWPASGEEAGFKLQPLKYNHPGLEVDLGVGLWAYPLPLDYDGDGDMDLLVSCPDKPSSGTYLFENPTQDRGNKLPIFRPGVRVGKGFHYMMLSMVDGEPVILRPGKEYRRDHETGTFDFDAPSEIQAPAKPNASSHPRTRANMWRYVDFDGDGDHDLAIGLGDWTDYGWDHAFDGSGRWRNGPLHGYVYVSINGGTNEKPWYESPHRLRAGTGDVDVYGWPSPNFADFDGDGDLDLLCGEFLDGFTYFQNVGSRTRPKYAAGQRLLDSMGNPLVMHLQMITPTAIDWDTDGDMDLIVGDEDGRVALIEHTGELNDGVPQFLSPIYFRQEADTLKFGALATPYVFDWDADGDEDILCGNSSGSIGFFENLGMGDSGLPRWAAVEELNVVTDAGVKPFRVMAGASGSIQGPCEAKWGYTTLSVADRDGDGDGDIVYNSILGRLGSLTNESGVLRESRFDSGLSEWPAEWYWWQRPTSDALTQWRTTPVLVDFDTDGKLDLVMLDQEGYLTIRSGLGSAKRRFIDATGKPWQLNAGTCGRSGRVKLSTVDWDGDGRMDVLVNSENATWYRNVETRDDKWVLKKVGNLARRNVTGHTSSPAVCDFDGNGKPDLLVGSENGRIYHIAHEECVTFDAEKLGITAPVNRDPPRLRGLVSEAFLFDDAPFDQCHASTICETSRGLVAAWFGGTKEGNSDVGIWSSYHDGLKWSQPHEVANGVQHDGLRYPCWNPVLFQPPGDAPTLLFFKVGPSPSQWWGEVMISHDRGRTFRDRRRLPEGIDGPVRCKPVLLGDGSTLLCGSSTEHDGWRVHFEKVGLNGGQLSGTWKRIGPIHDASRYNAIQPTLLRHDGGRWQALCRTREGVIVSSHSTDEGQTWSPLSSTGLPNPNSGIDAVTLADGRHLLVYNPLDSGDSGWGKRGVLSIAISHDGQDWQRCGDLEKDADAEFSYPAVIQSDDGLVHITYTHRRRRIKHLVIDPDQF